MADINENRPGYKKTKVGWVPEEWKYDLIENYSKRGSGHTPDKKRPEYYNGGIKWVSLADSNKLDDRYICETEIEISELGLANSSAVLHPGGTVILSRDAGVGKSAILKTDMAVSQHFMVWRCGGHLDNIFLYYYLQYQKPYFERMAFGSTIKTIGLKFFQKYKIILPPLPEQRRIAAILSTWDAAIGKLGRLIAKKRALKKGLMQQLLTGQRRFPEFVPEGGTRYKETKVGRVPVEWEYMAFGEVFSFLSTTSYSRSQLTYEETEREIYYIHYGDIHTIYKQPVIDIQLFPKVPKIVDEVSLPNNPTYLEDGDLIIADASEDYEGVGECIEVQILNQHKVISGLHTFAARDMRNKTVKGFRTYLLKNPEVRNALRRIATGSNVYGISKTNLAKFPIIIPSIPEQRRIAAVLSTCDEEIATLEREKERLEEQKKGLMQQLLTGAVRVKSEVGKRKSESDS